VRLATEHLGRLFRSQPGRRLPKQRQELMLIFSHIQFAQHPSDWVPGSSPCVSTAGLGGGRHTLNTRGSSWPTAPSRQCAGIISWPVGNGSQ
jgi:hypothetical protein